MKICAMLRVRNEARWIAEVLASIKPLTEQIIVFDDHSTDNTAEFAAAAGAWVVPSPFDDVTDEVRDKNYLLDIVRSEGAEYVLSIDGDELLAPGAADRIRARLRPDWSVYSFPIRYLWNDREHYRGDGVYGRFQRASMFSLVGQSSDVHFGGSGPGAKCGFHCGNIPQGLRGPGCTVQVDILHLGYMLSEDRIRKYYWYNQKDPHNRYEDEYKHMVIGDLFPSDSKFLHGGPLKTFLLPKYCTDLVF